MEGSRMSLADNLRKNPPKPWTPRPEILASDPLPLPIHGLAPRVVLGSEWWDTVRFAAYKSTNYHCLACSVLRGSTDWCRYLEGHEVYDIDRLLGRAVYVETVPLCLRCHAFVHPGYLRIKLLEHVITQHEYDEINQYCRGIMQKYNIHPQISINTDDADWSEWRMVVGGKEYPSLFKDFEAYRKHYAHP
jgi:hypothetical protein